VDGIAAQIRANGGFDPAHALLVRPKGDGRYQIVSGHHRARAAEQAGLVRVPCWVRELNDAEAYMALALTNTQGELHALEEGLHALESGMKVSAYADAIGRRQQTLSDRILAARVLKATGCPVTEWLRDHWQSLVPIHAAPEWLWPALAEALVAGGWTVETTRGKVAPLKDAPEPPGTVDVAAVAADAVAGGVKRSQLHAMSDLLT
jgi:ParB-like chromosome segregation protein Spo0J